jgi:phospholipid transport system transporter-binding protein
MPGTEAASIERSGETLRFAGAVLRDEVAGLWRKALPLLAATRRLDLTAVTQVDSAGVALLAELAARAGDHGLVIDGTPPGLAELRAAYRLREDLGFS